MNIEALSSYKSRNPLTARWLFHMIVINIWLWLHSFLSALDASLGSKIIQTFALPCCCVVDRSANEESIANNFYHHTSAAFAASPFTSGFL